METTTNKCPKYSEKYKECNNIIHLLTYELIFKTFNPTNFDYNKLLLHFKNRNNFLLTKEDLHCSEYACSEFSEISQKYHNYFFQTHLLIFNHSKPRVERSECTSLFTLINCHVNNLEVIKILLEKGFQPSLSDLFFALQRRKSKEVNLFLKYLPTSSLEENVFSTEGKNIGSAVIFFLNHTYYFLDSYKFNFDNDSTKDVIEIFKTIFIKYNCELPLWIDNKSKKLTAFQQILTSSGIDCELFSFIINKIKQNKYQNYNSEIFNPHKTHEIPLIRLLNDLNFNGGKACLLLPETKMKKEIFCTQKKEQMTVKEYIVGYNWKKNQKLKEYQENYEQLINSFNEKNIHMSDVKKNIVTHWIKYKVMGLIKSSTERDIVTLKTSCIYTIRNSLPEITPTLQRSTRKLPLPKRLQNEIYETSLNKFSNENEKE